MRTSAAIRYGAATLALTGLGLLAFGANAPAAHSQSDLIQDGKIGFVISDISYALTNDAGAEVACPNGLSMSPRDIFAATPEGQRRDGESDQDYGRRMAQGSQAITTVNGQNLCMNPEAGQPDPHVHPVTGPATTWGINLDGQESRANGRAAPGTCAHDDFRGVDGSRGIDNQFYRALGCTRTLQPGGQGNTWATEMLTGSWGILIGLEGVQDLRNDNDVTVTFYANSDPIQLSPTRDPLVNATYAAENNPRYTATAHGRIVNGVLTTDPVDVRFHWVVNSIRLDRPLQDARLRMTVGADGSLDGIMAGYSPVEEIYDTIFGFRSGRDGAGNPAPERLRLISSNGYAGTAGHTCNGVYYSLRQMADGHRNPATGRCDSISTQYKVHAVPAFIVHTQSRGANDGLDPATENSNGGGQRPNGQRGY